MVLRRNQVHCVVYEVDKLTPDISAEEIEEWALTTLQVAMGEKVISEISSETTARGIWNKLEELYLTKSLTNRLILLRTFFTYKMKEGTPIKSHLNVLDDLIMKMKSVDLKIDEEQMVMFLLCSLPERYTSFANFLIYGRDTITMADVKTGLLSEDLRDQMRGLNVDKDDGNNHHGLFVGRGHNEYQKRDKSRARSRSRKPEFRGKSKKIGSCHYCHQSGHWIKECPSLKAKADKEGSSSSVAVNDPDNALISSTGSETIKDQ